MGPAWGTAPLDPNSGLAPGGQPGRDQLCNFGMTGLPQRISATDVATGACISAVMEAFFQLSIIVLFLWPSVEKKILA